MKKDQRELDHNKKDRKCERGRERKRQREK